MARGIDGIYSGYMTGAEGNGFAMFVFLNGIISGSDPLGVMFDGQYSENDNGIFIANVTVSVPGGGTVIQGASAGPAGMTYTVTLTLDADFESTDFVRVSTPLGAVNLKLKKIRGLGGPA